MTIFAIQPHKPLFLKYFMADGTIEHSKSCIEVLGEEVIDAINTSIRNSGFPRVKLDVKPSTIEGAGLGLFAGEAIEENTIIGEYVGQLLSEEEGKGRSSNSRSYLMRLGGKPLLFVDAEPCKSVLLRYMNDARDKAKNNVRFEKIWKEGKALGVTCRAIECGEELFVSYGMFYWLNQDSEARHRFSMKLKSLV